MPKITFTEPLLTNQYFIFGDLGVYEGEANMNSRDGEGKMVYEKDSIYIYPTDSYDSADRDFPITYEGEWKDNQRHGKGVLYYNPFSIWREHSVPNKYEGQWSQNMRHGYGEEIMYKRNFDSWHTNPNTYTGEFMYNKKHGKGKMIYSSGSTYVGEWLSLIHI